MHHLIEELRAKLERPVSSMEILRRALQGTQATQGVAGMFTLEQLAYFSKHNDCIIGFLDTEDGKDALYLLLDNFKTYVEASGYAAAETEGGSPD